MDDRLTLRERGWVAAQPLDAQADRRVGERQVVERRCQPVAVVAEEITSIEAIQTSRGGSGVDGVQVGQRRAALTGQLGTGAQLGDRTQHVAGNRQPRLPADHLRRLARTR